MESELIKLGVEKIDHCKCILDCDGKDCYREFKIERSETFYKFSFVDADYFGLVPCLCSSCSKSGTDKVYAIVIAENDLVLLMPHDFHRFFVTQKVERRMKLRKIEKVA